ncbi:hypothetical protein OS493_016676 [Desmophyllum pertusum]|uniref:Uncharacterized protein n=1 Tax=Desmophyllum pertusum TaxID=174260 RepID=A0A9X0CXC5_9CNID|nr:hypothetical protein OS493_016676 [Desmophyllum pertusum]
MDKQDRISDKIFGAYNGVPGDENCYGDIDIRYQPCSLHFNVSKCCQEFCIDISGISDSLAVTYIAYLYYPGTRYIPIYVYINVRIKDAPIAAMTSSPHVPNYVSYCGITHKTSSVAYNHRSV